MNRNLEDEQGVIPAAISIADVLRGMARRKLFIVGLTAAAFLMSVSVVNVVKPAYTTEAQVLVSDLETPFDQVQSVPGTVAANSVSDRDLATQMAVIRSTDIWRRVIAALDLSNHPSFNPLIGGMGTVGKIKLKLGFGYDPRLKTPEQLALDALDDALTVYPVPSSNVIAIKVTTGNPKITAQVANTLAETYVASTREATTQPTERARQWLSQQIDSLRTKVSASDAAVEQFRSQAGLFQGQTSTLGAQELSELNSQITQAEAAKSDARTRADSIRNLLSSTGSVDASSDVLASNVIQNLKQQQVEAQRIVAELSAVYLSNHPKMIAASKQLNNINARIRTEALRIVDGLEEQAKVAEAREESLRASLERAKGKASTSNLDDVKLQALEREAQANRALLETLLARYAEATARLDPSAHPGFARVIQTAGIPTVPSFPKKGPLVLLITLAGLSLGLGLAFLLEMMAAATRLNERVFRAQSSEPEAESEGLQDDVEPAPAHAAATHAPEAVWQPPPVPPPVIAALPPVLHPGALAPGSSVNQILAWYDGRRGTLANPSLAITSLGGGAGDTVSVTLAVARLAASRGRRAVVIDISAAGSWFQQVSGAGNGPGIAELVQGSADFTKVIVRDAHSSSHLMRYGLDRSERARTALADRLKPVLQALAQTYDTVLLNCGEASQDTPAFVRSASAALIMAPAQQVQAVTSAIASLKSTGYGDVAYVKIEDAGNASAPALGPQFATA